MQLGLRHRGRHETTSSTAGFSSSTRSPTRKAAASASAARARCVLVAGVDDRQRPGLRADALAGRRDLGEAHGVVDGVVLAAAAAAEVDDRQPDGAHVDAGDDAGALGVRLDRHRRRRQVVVGALEEVARAAEGGDHAGEGLGGGAGLERRARVGVEPLQAQQVLAQRRR